MRTSTLATLALAFGFGAMAQAADEPARTIEQLVTITARVEQIDVAKREIVLKRALGNVATLIAP